MSGNREESHKRVASDRYRERATNSRRAESNTAHSFVLQTLLIVGSGFSRTCSDLRRKQSFVQKQSVIISAVRALCRTEGDFLYAELFRIYPLLRGARGAPCRCRNHRRARAAERARDDQA